jgi:hypothetical protein
MDDQNQRWLPPAQAAADAPLSAPQQPYAAPPPAPPAPAWNAAPPAYAPAAPAYPPAPVPYAATYCRACGASLHPQAAMCVQCGVATGALYAPPLAPAMPKDKSTAVVLVVLFGVFGWLYTYKRDAWKFWLNLGLTVVTIGFWGIAAWIWAIIDMSVRPSEWYRAFPNGQ